MRIGPMQSKEADLAESGEIIVIEEIAGRPLQTARQLALRLETAIRAGRLGAGHRLPNERRLAELAGLSRGTVRSALMTLEREGLVRRHVGRGTHVTEPREQEAPEGGATMMASAAHLLDFRMLLEPQLPDYLVLRASDEVLDEIALFVMESRKAATWQETEHADAEFHRRLCAASDNPLLIAAGRQMCLARAQPAWVRLKERRFDPERWRRYQREHEEIIAALKARDAAQARRLLQEHLAGVRQRFAL